MLLLFLRPHTYGDEPPVIIPGDLVTTTFQIQRMVSGELEVTRTLEEHLQIRRTLDDTVER